MSTELIFFLVAVNLVFPQLVISGLLYMLWWGYRPFIQPAFFSLAIIIVVFLFKFAFSYSSFTPLDPLFQNCLLLSIPKFTMPSLHAALGVFLSIFFSRPLTPDSREYRSIINSISFGVSFRCVFFNPCASSCFGIRCLMAICIFSSTV